jgi:hypothetical protein
MGLADDLLEQAKLLTTLDRGKPRQASLRRAESAAYYSLFHLLVADAAQRLVPHSQLELRNRVSRIFQHAEMKRVCKQFHQGATTPALHALLSGPISTELQFAAEIFVAAQEARHSADYDIGSRYTRSKTVSLVHNVELAFIAWRSIRSSDEADVFLAALAFASRWDR